MIARLDAAGQDTLSEGLVRHWVKDLCNQVVAAGCDPTDAQQRAGDLHYIAVAIYESAAEHIHNFEHSHSHDRGGGLDL